MRTSADGAISAPRPMSRRAWGLVLVVLIAAGAIWIIVQWAAVTDHSVVEPRPAVVTTIQGDTPAIRPHGPNQQPKNAEVRHLTVRPHRAEQQPKAP